MGQFCDPNVIFLEGVVTKCKLIVRERSGRSGVHINSSTISDEQA